MQRIQHRINTLEALKDLPLHLGAEIDLRTQRGEIILHHDPFAEGDLFKDFLKLWSEGSRTAPLILNTKEDGLEPFAEKLLQQFGVSEYFFLDTALPTLVRKTKGLKKQPYAVRFSEYEPLEFVNLFSESCDWVWIDSFQGQPYPEEVLKTLNQNFKTCLVSPELQGFEKERIQRFLPTRNFYSAVCTKRPELWD